MIGKTNSDGSAVDTDALTSSPGDVRAGKKFIGSGNDDVQTGTAADRGSPSATLKCGERYNIASGIYNGGSVTAADLKSQTAGTAAAADMKAGVKAWVGGVQLTGSMKNWSGTPNHITNRRLSNNRFEVAVDAGYHGCYWNGNSYEYMEYSEVASTLGLTAGNLAHGVTKCGMTGTYKGLGNAMAADVRKGKTFSSASLSNTTGTMAEQGGSTTTPGTANKTIVVANRYVTGNIVVAGDANLKAANIKNGVTIFGVKGTWQGYTGNLLLYNWGTFSNLSATGFTALSLASTSGTLGTYEKTIDTTHKVYALNGFYGCNPTEDAAIIRFNSKVNMSDYKYIKVGFNYLKLGGLSSYLGRCKVSVGISSSPSILTLGGLSSYTNLATQGGSDRSITIAATAIHDVSSISGEYYIYIVATGCRIDDISGATMIGNVATVYLSTT